MQPTQPFRSAEQVEQGVNALINKRQYDQALTLCHAQSVAGVLSWKAIQTCFKVAEQLEAHAWMRQLVADIQKAHPKLKEPRFHLIRALMHAALFEWQEALDALDQVRRGGLWQADMQLFRARVLERLLRPEEALAALDYPFAEGKEQNRAALVRATCWSQLKQTDRIIDELPAFLSEDAQDHSIAAGWKYLGKALDSKGRYDDAFHAFATGNAITASVYGFDPGSNDNRQNVEALRQVFTPSFVQRCSPVAPAERAPVFLVGFPRSGTTLLEQVLDSHPGIAAIEERPTVNQALRTALPVLQARVMMKRKGKLPGHWLEQKKALYGELAQLDQTLVNKVRERYWDTATEYLEPGPGQVLLDKMPLNSIQVGFIRRIFPNARFIVALRHPCDVLLSCYMQPFDPNPAMLNFVDLEQGAIFYRQVMALLEQYREVLGLEADMAYIRYEDLLGDFDGEVGRLLAFLDLPWDDTVRDYDAHARQRGTLSTPSYQGVTQKLYSGAMNRWHRYAAHLEPVLGHLQPAAERYGYSLEIPAG